jgi:hypothetical protein
LRLLSVSIKVAQNPKRSVAESSSANAERGGTKKTPSSQSLLGRRISGGGEGAVSPPLCHVVGTATHRITWSGTSSKFVQIITETGLRVYKELTPMKKDQVDLVNATVWIPDSKTPNGIAEIPLTALAIEAFKSQMMISGGGPFLFPSEKNPSGHQVNLKTAWEKTLKRAGVPYFRIYDLRSTYATRLSAGGVADEWVTQLLRQGDAKVFKKYSQMKLQMKREALEKMNRQANEMALDSGTGMVQ